MLKKDPSSIIPSDIHILESKDISSSNRNRWLMKDKKFGHIYDESKTFVKYSNILDNPTNKLFLNILELYFNSKETDVISKKIWESLLNLNNSFELLTDPINKDEFVCKLESMIDFLRDNEEYK